MNNRKVGTEKEIKAVEFLSKSGMRILEKNFRCRQGEIDIIGVHEGYLTFVEVKYRKNEKLGFPEEAVHKEKQRKICNVARVYIYLKRYKAEYPVRFDVVAICGEKIKWYQNAFPYGI
ncbi:MAG: YraN family protein [Lachnospiraceae bacterium]|nr:YraN family protein [Lachnospiraceae bacterium]